MKVTKILPFLFVVILFAVAFISTPGAGFIRLFPEKGVDSKSKLVKRDLSISEPVVSRLVTKTDPASESSRTSPVSKKNFDIRLPNTGAGNLPQPVAHESGQIYTVKRGDWLSKIAQKFYGDPAKYTVIVRANPETLKDPNVLVVGQKLHIPSLSKQRDRFYSVKSGDSLAMIARLFYGRTDRFKDILQANQGVIEDANTIYEGQLLLIP